MNYKEAVLKAKEIDKDLESTDTRFLCSVYLAHLDGTAGLYQSAFLLRHEDFILLFTEHHGYRVYHIDDLQHYQQFVPVPIGHSLGQSYNLGGYIEDVDEKGQAKVLLIDSSNLQRYRATFDVEVLRTLFQIKRRFRINAAGDEVSIEPLADNPVPEETVKHIIKLVKEKMTGRTDK